MSEPTPHDCDPGGAIFRATLPGWTSGISGPLKTAAVPVTPGRAAVEAAVLLAAVTILIPLCAPAGAGCAVLARRAGDDRWRAAFLASLWCGLLGAAVRGALGVSLVP